MVLLKIAMVIYDLKKFPSALLALLHLSTLCSLSGAIKRLQSLITARQPIFGNNFPIYDDACTVRWHRCVCGAPDSYPDMAAVTFFVQAEKKQINPKK